MTDETPTNNIEKELQGIFSLPPEAQKAMFSTLLKTMKEIQMQNKNLQSEVTKRDKAIEVFATAAIDIRQLHTIEEIADVLNMKADELTYLRINNKREYLKTIMRHFTTLKNEKLRQFKDMQVDPDGHSIGDKLDLTIQFFDKNRDVVKYDGGLIKVHPDKCEELVSNYKKLNEWIVLDADLINFNEAITHGVLYYAIDEMKKTTVDEAQSIAYNPEERLAKLNPELTKPLEHIDEADDEEKFNKSQKPITQQKSEIVENKKPSVFDNIANALGANKVEETETTEPEVPSVKIEKTGKKNK
jgi:hypothetical protein